MLTSAASGRTAELPVPGFFVSCIRGRQHGQDQVHSWHLWQKSHVPAASVFVASDTLQMLGISLVLLDIRVSHVVTGAASVCVVLHSNRLGRGSVVKLHKFPREDVAVKMKQESGFSVSAGRVPLFPAHLKRSPTP